MPQGAYIGVNNLAKQIKTGYVGVNGVARRIKSAYIGVNGVAQLCWSADGDGLFDADGNLIASWSTLISYGLNIEQDYASWSKAEAATDSIKYILTRKGLWQGRHLVIPASVTRIGSYAFWKCPYIESVTIGNGRIENGGMSIGNDAFNTYTNLKSVTISGSVTSIGEYAFRHCRNLANVNIANGVQTIGTAAFLDCHTLTSIRIPRSVTNMDSALYGTSFAEIVVDEDNATYCSLDGNVYSKDKRKFIQYATGKSDTSFTVPNGVTIIANYAFYGGKNLTGLIIPNGVTRIEHDAFSGCSMYSCSLPGTLTFIGSNVFDNCDNLTYISVTFVEAGQRYMSIDGVMYDVPFKDEMWLEYYPPGHPATTFRIPDGTTGLSSSAFSTCKNLVQISIPDGVVEIDSPAFRDCASLTSITVDANNKNYKSIDGNLYTKDGKILIQYAIGKTDAHFVIPDGVTTIGRYAFYWSDYLTSITIPNSVTTIEYGASSASVIEDVYYNGTQSQWNAIAIDNEKGQNDALINATIHYNS